MHRSIIVHQIVKRWLGTMAELIHLRSLSAFNLSSGHAVWKALLNKRNAAIWEICSRSCILVSLAGTTASLSLVTMLCVSEAV